VRETLGWRPSKPLADGIAEMVSWYCKKGKALPASVFIVSAGAFLAAVILTWWVRRLALARGMMDIPNARSSHSLPTPRGGGLAIVLASAMGIFVLTLQHVVEPRMALALTGGLPVALIGFLDDRGSVTIRSRFLVQTAASIWAVCILGGVQTLQFGGHVVNLGITGNVLSVLTLMWTLNCSTSWMALTASPARRPSCDRRRRRPWTSHRRAAVGGGCSPSDRRRKPGLSHLELAARQDIHG